MATFVELASLPSAITCSACGAARPSASPYPGGIASAIQARPRSRYGSTSFGLVTTSTIVKFGDASKRATSARLATDRSASATTTGTSRTSVVAAYPSMNSCRIGARMTMPKRSRSSFSSINSFHTRTAMRPMILR